MLVHPSSIDLFSRTLRCLSAQLRARRREIGTRRWRLPADRQALLVLAHLRCGDTCAQLAAGFRIGIATVHRCIREVIDVLAALAPPLTEAMKTIRTKALVILDCTLLQIDRIAADTPYYSGKHKRHGMNVQVLTDPFGRLLWASPALPGSVHDLTAARTHGIIDAHAAAEPKCWADKAYQGAGHQGAVAVEGVGEEGSSGGTDLSRESALVSVRVPPEFSHLLDCTEVCAQESVHRSLCHLPWASWNFLSSPPKCS